MAYRVPPSRDPHLTLQPHPWGDGAAPPLAPPPIIAYLSATWKQRTVQRPQPSELLPLTLIPSRSAPLNEEAVGGLAPPPRPRARPSCWRSGVAAGTPRSRARGMSGE